LQFDLLKDFEPIAQLAVEPLLIVGKKSMPANTLKELIAYLRARPDTASAGIAGVGAAGHLTGIAFQRETGARFQFVPYRGNGPATQDLVAGQIDLMIEPSSNFQAFGAGGKHQGLCGDIKHPFCGGACNSDSGRGGITRLLLLALVWALGAQGHAEVCHRQAQCRGYRCLGRSGGTKRLADLGLEIPRRNQQTPEALGALQKAETEKWWPIIKDAGIKVRMSRIVGGSREEAS